jgi:hypothetical protein
MERPEHFHTGYTDSYTVITTRFSPRTDQQVPAWFSVDESEVRTYMFSDLEYMLDWMAEAITINTNEGNVYFDRSAVRVVSNDGYWLAPNNTVVRLTMATMQPEFTGDERVLDADLM